MGSSTSSGLFDISRKATAVKGRGRINSMVFQRRAIAAPLETSRSFTPFQLGLETVTEGGRRFMAAWRKEDVDAARHRQEKREATRLENLLS